MADGVRAVLGDGSGFGVQLQFVEEPRPLGTGGALKFAELDLRELAASMRGDVLIDGRNFFDVEGVREAGLAYEGVGRPAFKGREPVASA